MEKAIVLAKYKSPWEPLLLSKLSKAFEVDVIYLDEIIRSIGFSGSISWLNKLIEGRSIGFLFFDIEFYPCIDKNYLGLLSSRAVKVALYFDDILMHDFNSITACSVDVVLVADPIAVLKYREVGMVSYYFPLESSAEVFQGDANKSHDILFFGSLDKADRREWISFLESNGLEVKIVGPDSSFVTFDEMAALIRDSRIVLDLSKSSNLCRESIHDASRRGKAFFCYYYQMKGRAIMAGLGRTCCISEYTPATRLLFDEDEVPTFTTKYECLNLVNELLKNQEKLDCYAKNLSAKIYRLYEDSALMNRLVPLLVKRSSALICSDNLPAWYRARVYRARFWIVVSYFRRRVFRSWYRRKL